MSRSTQTNFTADSFTGKGGKVGEATIEPPDTDNDQAQASDEPKPAKKAAKKATKKAASKGNENNDQVKKAASSKQPPAKEPDSK